MYTNREQHKWHKREQRETLNRENDIRPYAIPTIIIALGSLVVSGIFIF